MQQLTTARRKPISVSSFDASSTASAVDDVTNTAISVSAMPRVAVALGSYVDTESSFLVPSVFRGLACSCVGVEAVGIASFVMPMLKEGASASVEVR